MIYYINHDYLFAIKRVQILCSENIAQFYFTCNNLTLFGTCNTQAMLENVYRAQSVRQTDTIRAFLYKFAALFPGVRASWAQIFSSEYNELCYLLKKKHKWLIILASKKNRFASEAFYTTNKNKCVKADLSVTYIYVCNLFENAVSYLANRIYFVYIYFWTILPNIELGKIFTV